MRKAVVYAVLPLIAAAGLLFAQSAFSGEPNEPAGQKKSAAQEDPPALNIINDQSNYVGDRTSFEQDMIVEVQGADGTAKGKACMPARTLLRGSVAYSSGGETGTLFRVIKPRYIKAPETSTQDSHDPVTKPVGKVGAKCNPALYDATQIQINSLDANMVIRVSKKQIESSPPSRFGLTYGALAVPFKYQLTGSRTFTGAATIGPYVGYRTSDAGYGLGLSFVGFMGAANISVSQNVDGKNVNQSMFGLSYGAGVIATVKGSFQLGGVIGFDRVNSATKYPFNGKPWLAVELGYSFMQ